MNKTKRSLILAAGIIEMISAVFMLFAAVLFLVISTPVFEEVIAKYIENAEIYNMEAVRLMFIIISAVEFGLYTIASILLLNSVRSNGAFFAKSKKSYIAGVVITILLQVIGIPSILLYCSLGIKDEEKTEEVKPVVSTSGKTVKEVKIIEVSADQTSITKTIIGYKTLRDQGIITDTDYKGMVIRYLRDLKESGKITEDQFDQLLTKLI